ncbi:MAG: hypothetical protein M1495_18660 [Bacteroidetes bacterium]|nr:hypothetical protein [Bacteroidota bacterium]
MYLTAQTKIASLKAIQSDLLDSYKTAKSVQIGTIAEEHLKIEKSMDAITDLNRAVEKLIRYYETFKS